MNLLGKVSARFRFGTRGGALRQGQARAYQQRNGCQIVSKRHHYQQPLVEVLREEDPITRSSQLALSVNMVVVANRQADAGVSVFVSG